jgi:hypothetical protein
MAAALTLLSIQSRSGRPTETQLNYVSVLLMGHRFKPGAGYVLEGHLPLGEGGEEHLKIPFGVKNFVKRGIFLKKNKER